MSHRTATAVWALAALGFAAAGCADEVESRPAAYPEPIGYTTPPSDPPPAATAPAVSADDDPTEAPAAAPSDAVPADDDVVVEGAPVPTPAESGAVSPPPADDSTASASGYGDADPAALSDFRSTLDPYGTWVEDPTYGTVWSPSASVVGDGFTPYVTSGHWAYDDDYVWVSDYSWGWAPFHYGRWVYVAGSGWAWIPGRQYAGAWVSWRYGEGPWGYVGWAPLPPAWCWHHGAPVHLGFIPRAPYSFVARNDLFTHVPGARMVAGPQVLSVAAHTRPYVPASPSVVGGVGVGGPRLASGPPPAMLNLSPSSVVHTTPVDRGVVQARAFASPGSAVATGARPPQPFPARAWQSRGTTTLTGNVPASPPAGPSHFGGRFGAGFTGNVYATPAPVQGTPYPTRPAFGAPTPLPANRGPVRLGPAPAYGPAVRTGPTPIYRSLPSSGYPAAAPAPVRSTPVFRSAAPAAPAAPSGGFHGGGSYGGFRGGGFRGGGGRGGGHR
jgi:hypothetical protein